MGLLSSLRYRCGVQRQNSPRLPHCRPAFPLLHQARSLLSYLCHSRTDFSGCSSLMDDGNIHRVYVCSEGSVMRGKPRPIHVITLTDMLEAVLNQYTSLG